MRRLGLLAPVLTTMLACPGRPTGDTETSSTTESATTTTSTSTTTTTTTTTTVDTSTGAVSVTEPTTEPATTTDTTTTSSTTTTDSTSSTSTSPGSSSGGSTTGAPGDVEYAAQYFAGGLDRIFIRKADHGADRCTQLIFVWPGQPDPSLDLPDQWGVQSGEIVQGTASCLDFQVPLMNAVFSSAAEGSATWAPGFCPLTLDLDITLTFPQAMPWVPAQDHLQALALPVQGC